MISLENSQQRVNWLTSSALLHQWTTEPWNVRTAIQMKKRGPRHGDWYINVPKISYRQGQNQNPDILASSLLVFLFHMTKLFFLLLTNNKENEHFACSFSRGTTLALWITCLSSLSFYLRLSPEAFHMLSHLHICALKCFQTLTLLSCSTSLVLLSLFLHLLAFFLCELVWIFYLVGSMGPKICSLHILSLVCFEMLFHLSLPLSFPSSLNYFQLGTPGFWCVSQHISTFTLEKPLPICQCDPVPCLTQKQGLKKKKKSPLPDCL